MFVGNGNVVTAVASLPTPNLASADKGKPGRSKVSHTPIFLVVGNGRRPRMACCFLVKSPHG